MAKLPKTKISKPSRRTLIQFVAFGILMGGAAFYLMKPGADANRAKTAARNHTVKAKPVRKAAVERPAPPKQKPVQSAAKPPAAKAPAATKKPAPPAKAEAPEKAAPAKKPAPAEKPAAVKTAPAVKTAAATPEAPAKPPVVRSAADDKQTKPPVRKASASTPAKPEPDATPKKPAAKAAPKQPAPVMRKKPAGTPLVPHQAFYSVKAYEIGSRSKTPVKQGEGELHYRLYCGRWTFRSSAELQPVSKDDGAPESFAIVHRQSKDGRSYSVKYTTFEDRTWSVTTSQASLTAAGEGEAFAESASERRLIALPKGAVFPVTYLNKLLMAAKADKYNYQSIAYGSARPFMLLRVVAQIGPSKIKPSGKIPAVLRSKKVWRIDYVYTDAAEPDRSRTFKASVAINEHGVILWREMDYGGLRLVYKLENVVEAPAIPCREKKSPGK
jgi:hypothetical protein